jgi:hypothetical protein
VPEVLTGMMVMGREDTETGKIVTNKKKKSDNLNVKLRTL